MGAEIFTNFRCFVHNFGYRYARKSFKGSKDAKRMAQWVGVQGRPKKSKNTPTCGSPPREPPTEYEKKNFSIWTRRLAESVEGLNSSPAQSPGKLQDCKALQKKWLAQDLKGFKGSKDSASGGLLGHLGSLHLALGPNH